MKFFFTYIYPVFVGLITFLITRLINKKDILPKLLLSHFFIGWVPSDEKIKNFMNGYFKKEKELNNDFILYLKNIGYKDLNFESHNILSDFYRYDKDKNYVYSTKDSKKISKIYYELNDIREFKEKLCDYAKYSEFSKWNIKITNIGNTNAFDFRFYRFKESEGSTVVRSNQLNSNDSIEFVLFYFDDSMKKKGNELTWDYDYKNIFYLKKRKIFSNINCPNRERIFQINYKDCYGKEHHYICYSKVIKQKNPSPFTLK